MLEFDSGSTLKNSVGIYVGLCNFKHRHYGYNSVCYELSLTAGTEQLIIMVLLSYNLNECQQL